MKIKALLSGLLFVSTAALASQANAEVFESKGSYGNFTKEGCYWQMVAHWGVKHSWGHVNILLCQTGSGSTTHVEHIATKKTSYYYNTPTCTLTPSNITKLEGSSCSSYRLSRK